MTETTRSPIIRTETGRFVRHIDVDGLGKYGFVDFERTIQWFRETDAQAIVMAPNGQKIHHGSTYNDFYGLMTSMNEPFAEAKRFCEQYDVAHTGCVVAVVLECSDIPGIVVDEDSAIRDMKRFRRVPDDWMHHDLELQDAYAKASWEERLNIPLDRIRTIKRDPVTLWRSDWDSNDILQARRVFEFLLDDLSEEHRTRIASRLDETLEGMRDIPCTSSALTMT